MTALAMTAMPIVRHPAHQPWVSAFPLDDDLVLCDERSGAVYVLNATGRLIWTLCDGTRSSDDVARELRAAYGVDLARARDDVRTVLANVREAGLMTDG